MADLIYDFKLDSIYAGYEVTITDVTGAELEDSPFTLDENGDYRLTITDDGTGRYTATIANPGSHAGAGVTVADGVLNLAASIAAIVIPEEPAP